MSQITASLVKELREKTGAGMMDCKRALEETGGEFEAAIDFLRKKGLARAANKASRVAAEGVVESYVHAQGKIGVIVEVNCETDFVSRTDDFITLAHDIALQIAASAPRYVRREEVPAEVVEHEEEVLAAQARESGKPEAVIAQMVKGRLDKFYEEACLLEQPFIKEPKQKVSDIVTGAIARLGENIVIRRFTRYELGAGIERTATDFAEEVRQQAGH